MCDPPQPPPTPLSCLPCSAAQLPEGQCLGVWRGWEDGVAHGTLALQIPTEDSSLVTCSQEADPYLSPLQDQLGRLGALPGPGICRAGGTALLPWPHLPGVPDNVAERWPDPLL